MGGMVHTGLESRTGMFHGIITQKVTLFKRMVYKPICFKVTLKLAANQLVQTLYPEKCIGFRTKVKNKNLMNLMIYLWTFNKTATLPKLSIISS